MCNVALLSPPPQLDDDGRRVRSQSRPLVDLFLSVRAFVPFTRLRFLPLHHRPFVDAYAEMAEAVWCVPVREGQTMAVYRAL